MVLLLEVLDLYYKGMQFNGHVKIHLKVCLTRLLLQQLSAGFQ
jgi:hypothetical protein